MSSVKTEKPSLQGPFSPEHLVANIWMLLGYYNGLWMTSSFPDDSPQTAFDLGQITHSLFGFCICSQCFWFKTKHDLVWASRRSQHPFRFTVRLFLTLLTPVYSSYPDTLPRCLFPRLSNPTNFWSWGRALWCSRVQCGTTELPSGVCSKEHTGVRRQWPYPTPPPATEAASCLLATAWYVYHKEFCSWTLKFGNHSETVFGI